MTAPIEHRITTPDGRTLAAAEWGDPSGVPLISIHGTPSGRLGRWRDASIYERVGVRRITFDRAGYGLSTRRPGRRVADIVDDVATIADALGIDRFAVTGRSGGGPHTLACAALLGDRVLRCAAVVAVAPFDADGLDWFAGQTPGNVTEGELALEGETALRVKLEADARTILELIASGADEYPAGRLPALRIRPRPAGARTARSSPRTCPTRSATASMAGSMTTWRSSRRGASMSPRSPCRHRSGTAAPTRSSRPPTATGWRRGSRTSRSSRTRLAISARMPTRSASWSGSRGDEPGPGPSSRRSRP